MKDRSPRDGSKALPPGHGVAFGFQEETWEAKLAWFATLTPLERLQHLDQMYQLAVSLNPKLRGGRDAEYASTAVRVVELPPGE